MPPEMEGIAATKTEADSQLERLRKERGVSDESLLDSALVSSLDQALNIVSDQLYQTSTHFLLELIQNADDNSYRSTVVPSLSLTLYHRSGRAHLRTDCNEIGFTYKQIDALLRVGQSTKKTVSHGQKGYIGEKGIGFKSVFKVADVVHVASGFYEFKLDRSRSLGMILPLLSAFPSTDRRPGNTQFLLEINDQAYANQIRDDLEQDIEPQLLMFLRNLETLHISTSAIDKIYRRECTKDDVNFGGETISIFIDDQKASSTETEKYIVHRYYVTDLPSDPKRQGVTISEVVVAFPITNSATPIATRQKAYAFLPIADFGLNFLVHADFLLVASRERLENKRPWNDALRLGIVNAFIGAVNRFIEIPPHQGGDSLRYSWPLYLPTQSANCSFWDTLARDIAYSLQHEQVLESRNKDWEFMPPNRLYFVPHRFRFQGGYLFESPSIAASHVAFDYDGVKDKLGLIGVRRLTIEELCLQFQDWITEVGIAGIQAQDLEWHRRISTVFLDEWTVKETLKTLPIVPLENGTWVSAATEHLYLASKTDDEHVPAGVNILIVDQGASQDPERRRFFEFLDIKEYSPRQVCNLILELHRSLRYGHGGRDLEDSVSDAAYFFKHRNILENEGAPDIYFHVIQEGNAMLTKEELYLVDSSVQPNLIAKYRDTAGCPFRTLDDLYVETICNGNEKIEKEFLSWLLVSRYCSFEKAPILTRDGRISEECAFLRQQSVLDLLYAVKQDKRNLSDLKILELIPSLEFSCLDGVQRELAGLAVPTEELLRECSHLKFADLPDPSLNNWDFLTNFRVLTKCNTESRLRELEALSKLGSTVDENAIHDLYRALDACASVDKEIIREAFQEGCLIYTAKPGSEWVKHNQCVWSAPAALKSMTRLQSRYKDCRRLFNECLRISPAGIAQVVDEFCSISNEPCKDPAKRFNELAGLMNLFYTSGSRLSTTIRAKINTAKSFPIIKPRGRLPGKRVDVAWCSLVDAHWYIPDSIPLEACFRGKLNILDLDVRLAVHLMGLFTELGADAKFLSNAVMEEVEPREPKIRDIITETTLKVRLKYISHLEMATNGHSARDTPQIEVWSVPSIKRLRRLESVEIVEEDQLITIVQNKARTNIYFSLDMEDPLPSTVNYELIEYFCSKIGVKTEDYHLANLLMSAPENELDAIMERHNRFLPPENSDSESDREVLLAEDSTSIVKYGPASNGEPTSAAVEHSHEQSKIFLTPAALSKGEGLRVNTKLYPSESAKPSPLMSGGLRVDTTLYPSESPKPSPFMHDLIPSHGERVERIVRRASTFKISDSIVTTPSAPTPSVDEGRPSFRQEETKYTHFTQSWGSFLDPKVSPGLFGEGFGQMKSPRYFGKSFDQANEGFASTADLRKKEIGYLGERFVYQILQRYISDWSFENWTSNLRKHAGHPGFYEKESDFSDFTYTDTRGKMRDLLKTAGMKPDKNWSASTTYHLKVKTTMKGCNEPFHLSQTQIDRIRAFENDLKNVFILVRAFEIESETPGLKLFFKVWSLFLEHKLDLKSDEGYLAYEVA